MRALFGVSLSAALAVTLLSFPAAPAAANTPTPAADLPGTSSPTTPCYDTLQADAPVYEQVLTGWTPAGTSAPPYQLPPTTTYVQQSYTEMVPVQRTRQVPYTETVTKTRQVPYTETVTKTRQVKYTEQVKKTRKVKVCKDVKKTGTRSVQKQVEEKIPDYKNVTTCHTNTYTGKQTCVTKQVLVQVFTRRYTVTVQESYTYWDTECHNVEETYWDTVEKTRQETYTEQVTKTRTETYTEPVTRYRTESYTELVPTTRTRLVPVTSPGAWVYPPPSSAPQPIYESRLVGYETVTRYVPADCPVEPPAPEPVPVEPVPVPVDPPPVDGGTIRPA